MRSCAGVQANKYILYNHIAYEWQQINNCKHRVWRLSCRIGSLVCLCKVSVWMKYLTGLVFPCNLASWLGFIGATNSVSLSTVDLSFSVFTALQSENVWLQARVWSCCAVLWGFDWWPESCYEAKLSDDDCQPDWVYELKSRSGRQTAKLSPDVQIPDTHSAPLGLQKAVV